MTTTPRPALTLSELAARYTPEHGYATIAATPAELELGDVIDHTDGLVVVTEITRRHQTWPLGGYDPLTPDLRALWVSSTGAPAAPQRVRHAGQHTRLRVRRPATAWKRLPGHTKKITSQGAVKRGMYTTVAGYTAACSCDWTTPEPCTSHYHAEQATIRHRAAEITAATHLEYRTLTTVEALERVLSDVLPWEWRHGTYAELRGLTTQAALARITPWATALGTDIEHIPANAHGLGGEHYLWINSRSNHTGTTPRVDIRAYPIPVPAAGR